MRPQNIYFDESGFTGDNLLHPEQPYFAYASVATDDEEASSVVNRLFERYRLQGDELKGNRLVRSAKGRQAIDDTFEHFAGRIKISISDKRFALACKLYEYIFEPSISVINSVFYEIDFHLFVANFLYLSLAAQSVGADAIFGEFERLIRGNGIQKEGKIFSSVQLEESPYLACIIGFARLRADDVRAELTSLSRAGMDKWRLDLTLASIFSLLGAWGTEVERICAICDSSKPLRDDRRVLNRMVNRKKRNFVELLGRRFPISFELSESVRFSDSKKTHGIQIADALAAAAIYVKSGADCEYAKKWRVILAMIGSNGSVMPDRSLVDPQSPQARLNAAVLIELHTRAKRGVNLTEGMPELIEVAYGHLLGDYELS